MARERESGDAPEWWCIGFFWLPLGILIWVIAITVGISALRWAGLIGGA